MDEKTNKYIVLDLDSTLINTFQSIESLEKLNLYSSFTKYEIRKRLYTIDLHDVIDEPGTGSYTRMWGAIRPGWKRFRNFIFSYFKGVIVWSAGQPLYVDAIVNILFPECEFQPFIVYTSDNCKGDEFENIYKPLQILIDNLKIDGLNLETIYAIDDREDTFSHNNDNGIQIPIYAPKPTEKDILKSDNALLQLENWFSKNEVKNQKDVRKLDKKDIFKN
jgi:hypothetical protein